MHDVAPSRENPRRRERSVENPVQAHRERTRPKPGGIAKRRRRERENRDQQDVPLPRQPRNPRATSKRLATTDHGARPSHGEPPVAPFRGPYRTSQLRVFFGASFFAWPFGPSPPSGPHLRTRPNRVVSIGMLGPALLSSEAPIYSVSATILAIRTKSFGNRLFCSDRAAEAAPTRRLVPSAAPPPFATSRNQTSRLCRA